jgi:NTP pyrophosphatase (non-canonical NTP hydrolase)
VLHDEIREAIPELRRVVVAHSLDQLEARARDQVRTSAHGTGTLGSVTLAELQHVIERTFGERDRRRGVPASVAWLAEEVGELAQAVRKGTPEAQQHEFADVLAWVASLANQLGVDLTTAVDRYARGCPRCREVPCACPM